VKSAEKRVSRIKHHADVEKREVIEKMVELFVEDKEFEHGYLTD
jgi:hypothetical protein